MRRRRSAPASAIALGLSLVGILVLAAAPGPAVAAISAPAGVIVRTVAAGLGQPTNLAFDARGRLWTTSAGNVVAPTDGVWLVPRAGARPRHVVRRLFAALGLAWYRDELYVASIVPYATIATHRGQVLAYGDFDGRRFRHRRTVLRGLPVGLHNLDSIVPGPGGRLYLGVGSRHDTSAGARLAGTVVSFLPSGRGLRVEARGLRNPYGLAFVPGTADLLVTDNGRDDLGAFAPPDELNVLDVTAAAPSFGFPACHGQGGAACAGTLPPLASLAPHASADGLAVAPRFGASAGAVAFVAENGSSFARNPTGNDVLRIDLTREGSGWRAATARFATGFRPHDPLGAAIGPDGALYVTLWSSGRVVRFAANAP